MDIDFEKLSKQIAEDDYKNGIEDILIHLTPEMMAGFTIGRYIGRADILLKLAEIIQSEEKSFNNFAKLLGGKHGKMEN